MQKIITISEKTTLSIKFRKGKPNIQSPHAGVMNIPKPILKWAGGKSSLLELFYSGGYIPEKFGTYYEPFFGGGALFFFLWKKNLISKAVISDVNSETINLYEIIKEDCCQIIEKYQSMELANDSACYYVSRERFNQLKTKTKTSSCHDELLERAILLLYLNRTCFNGLYRENKSGEFNVPFGKYKNPLIIDEENLKIVHKAFQCASIKELNYKDAVQNAIADDFIYFDPPYMPLSETSNFNDYSKLGFGPDDQLQLSKIFRVLDKRGCYVMASNSSNPYIAEIYDEVHAKKFEVSAPRLINSKGTGRGNIIEYLMTNYEPTPKSQKIQTKLNSNKQ